MFNVTKVEEDARAELAKERGEKAKGKIKDHLKRIATAESVVENLRREYKVMLAEIAAE